MRISNREFQLANDLMELQRNYNLLLAENAALLSSQSAKEELLNKEVLRLSDLLKRAKSFESPKATLARKKREENSGSAA